MNSIIPSLGRADLWRAVTWLYSRSRRSGVVRPGLRILMYHAVGTSIEDDRNGIYNIKSETFREHMTCLAVEHRECLTALKLPAESRAALEIAVTFDDGYLDNLTVAAPVLVELEIPFTVFVCTDAVAQRHKGFLDARGVSELSALPGVQIGSHSASHARLTRCNDKQLREELVRSKSYLEDVTGQEVVALSYPHGDVDRRVRDAAELAGYKFGATSRFDINLDGRDPLLLSRTDIWSNDVLPVFGQKLRGDWDWRRWRHQDPANTA